MSHSSSSTLKEMRNIQELPFLKIFEAQSGLGLIVSPELRILGATDSLLKETLTVRENIVGKYIFDVFPDNPGAPDASSTTNLKKAFEHVLAKSEPYSLHVLRYDIADPEKPGCFIEHYWNTHTKPIVNDVGEVICILHEAINITEEVSAKRQLKGSLEREQMALRKLEERVEQRTQELRKAQGEAERQSKRLNSLFTQAPAAICILDGPDLVFELVNPGYAALFPERSLLGRPILEVLPEIRDNEVYRTFRKVYETGITHEETEMLIPFIQPENGIMEERYFRYVQQARYNEQNEVDGVVVFALEVTEQVWARKSEEASVQQLRLVTNSLPVLIGYLNREERFLFANKAYEKWFPHKSEDLIGKTLRELIGEVPYQNVKKYIEQGLAGESVVFEARMPYRKDFVKYIHCCYVPDIRDGLVHGFYTLVTDISEQVLVRQALEESEHKAKGIAEMLAVTNQELKLANDTLARYNFELETRVADRTSELQKANKQLQKQIRENKKAEESLTESHKKLQALTRHLQVMREDERKYIARELHDELGQSFTALKIDLTLIMKKLDVGQMEKDLFHAELQSMMKTINSSITSVREMVATLRPTVLDNFGLLSEIESQAQEFQKRTSIAMKLNTPLKYIPLGQEASIEVFRIIQESITNIARHSEATAATITIDKSDNHFRFAVTDNGKGMQAGNLTELRTFGLLGMQERADRIGANLTFVSMPDEGTKIILEVPFTELATV